MGITSEMSRIRELADEFRTVFTGRGNLFDSVVPLLVFLVANAVLGFEYSALLAVVTAAAIAAVRLTRHQPWAYALGGLGAVVLAFLATWWLGRAGAYFLPAMASGAVTAAVCAISVLVRRPVAALTSHLTRGWPIKWYWHTSVRPAYAEVSVAWAFLFGSRLLLQLTLFRRAATDALAVASLIMGWPATIAVLASSYVYGTWRLRRLGGPSVEELTSGAQPPWIGQRRGF